SLPAEIKAVISNRPDAYAITRAKKHGLPWNILEHDNFQNREEFDQELIRILKTSNVELVVLAGFMRLLTPVFLNAFPQRIVNIHPALLPSFPGIHAQKKALDYGVKFSGCTVHFIDEGIDSGPIIIQSVVPVHDDDTEDTLAARILQEEHRIYPLAIKYYAEGRIDIQGRKVRIKDAR
ncbi:MAG TPA: phosphoribosylglycinamide formyltransferase, partial [Smithellaceae bacterium]|nr:phosphoribosylglycinamide formyltransferase [Smithellaceae bacterium]